MLCFVVIGITGRCQNWLVILSILSIFLFKCWHFNGLSDIQRSTAGSLSDFIAIRDGQLCLPPLFFSSQQLGDIIDCLCTSWLYALFWVCAICVMSVYILLVLDLCTWSTNKYNNNNCGFDFSIWTLFEIGRIGTMSANWYVHSAKCWWNTNTVLPVWPLALFLIAWNSSKINVCCALFPLNDVHT